MGRFSIFFTILLALSTVGCDQSTKLYAMAHLQEAPHALIPGIQLTYAENRDMAFGLLSALLDEQARLWLLTFAKSAAVLFGAGWLVARHKISTNFERVGLSLVVAGAAGNLIDRVRHGFVVDFVKVPYWPVFNVADVAIVAGMGLLLLAVRQHSKARLET